MINALHPNYYKNFEHFLGLYGPDHFFEMMKDKIGRFCLIRVEKTAKTEDVKIYDISKVGRGINKEWTCKAVINGKSPKTGGWFLAKYVGVDDHGYDVDGDHNCIPIVNPIKFIKDEWVCDDKSPLGIFLGICLDRFDGSYIVNLDSSPAKNCKVGVLISSCRRLNRRIGGTTLATINQADRKEMISLFLKNEINVDMISTWLDPYNLRK